MKKAKKKKKKNAPQVVIIFYICFVQVHVKNTGWRLRSRLYAWMASWTLAVVNLRHKLFIQSHTCPSMLYDRAICYSNAKKCLMCMLLLFNGLHRLHILFRGVSLTFDLCPFIVNASMSNTGLNLQKATYKLLFFTVEVEL